MQLLTIATLVKAVSGVAVVGKDDDAMASFLQAHGGVDDESLRTTDAQVGMEEDEGVFGGVVFDCFIRHGFCRRMRRVTACEYLCGLKMRKSKVNS